MRRTPTSRLASALLALALAAAMASCSDEEPETDGGLTNPGSELKVGDTATVHTTASTATIKLTVTKIEEGSANDVPSGVEGAADHTPYYAHFDMELVEGDPYGGTMDTYLTAYAGDEWAGNLKIGDPFPQCQEKNWAMDPAPGTTVRSCLVFMAPDDAGAVDEVWFTNDSDYSEGDDNQVVWSPAGL